MSDSASSDTVRPSSGTAGAGGSLSAVLSRREIYAYGMGGVSHLVPMHAVSYLANPVYNVMLGVSPILISNVLSASQVAQMLIVPAVAYFSDNLRSRWGRRRPFIAIGGGLNVLFFWLFFLYPPQLSLAGMSVFFAFTVVATAVAASLWKGPYDSLLPELSPLPQERAYVLGVQLQLRTLFTFGTIWCLPLAQSVLFPSTSIGLRVVGAGLAAVTLVGIISSVRWVKERHLEHVLHQERVGVMEALRETLRIRPIYPLLIAVVLLGVAGNLVNSLGFYLVTYYGQAGNLVDGNFFTAAQGTAWLSAVLLLGRPAVRLCNRFGRRRMFLISAGLMIVASLLKLVCYYPGAGYSTLIPHLIMGPAWSVANVIFQAEAADLTDWDELRTHRRREAVILTAIGWISTLAIALSFAAPGYLLVGSGFELGRGASQAPGVYAWIMGWFVVIPVVFSGLAIWAHHHFPIDERKAAEIRRELEQRRGTITA